MSPVGSKRNFLKILKDWKMRGGKIFVIMDICLHKEMTLCEYFVEVTTIIVFSDCFELII